MPKIMIVEDEPSIRDELTLLLENESYTALAIEDFDRVAEQVDAAKPDLILLDLGLPGRDGFALCADIRKTSSIPIIFVTSRDTAMDELRALSMGGDDYITKPYNIPLLLARIKTVLRRSGVPAESEVSVVGGLTLDLAKGTVSVNGKSAELTRNEIRILAHLMGRPGQIISRADLIEALWDNQIYIDDNTLSVNMTRLRAKLDSLGLPDYIKTRRGMGYQI
ncbi:response regulator transcription factor [Ohessyouella blattaphilus]|uniref:Stage 0 sporulation protein A homolog n=1 Tax=Ohessyouella blattaphilus TaxID=2949333 RepID=A0ABT1EGB6_9FIRM|nr:response regulator transcription factor [Ohessyouella blattaphilus]MCP1109733.1 response regulator transcription factor [Ohessyouella blattaphilus]MCR8563127.1 response regulator transcription factor [Ohessyouella blattaphilus]